MKTKFWIYGLLIIVAFITGWWVFNLVMPEKEQINQASLPLEPLPGHGFNRTANFLNLDYEQRTVFQDLEQAYRSDIASLSTRMQTTESAIIRELSEKKPDTIILQKYAEETGTIQAEIKLLTIEHFLAVREICNPEQAEKLNILFSRMETGFRGGRGQGQGQGEERGRRYQGGRRFNQND
jgi:Spy/CpxP family protein refolding chaperone